MATSQAPLLKFRGIDTTTGLPLVGGKLFTYAAGTVNKLTTYTDSTGNTPNANPIILDARGECDLFFTQTLLYKLTLSPATDTDPPTAPIWTEDQVVPIGSAADIITNTANLAASTGATLVGWISKATGAIATTISKWIDRQTPSVFDFMTDAQIADVQAGTLLVDVTAACQAALTASKSAIFNDGGYRLTDNLLLKTGQCVQLSSGVTLRQYTADKNIFRAVMHFIYLLTMA